MDCHVSKIPVLLPTDDNAVYLITGANRGIGLEHARQFLEKTKAHVVCTVRKSSTIKHLQAFEEQGRSHRLLIVELDTTDEKSIQVAFRFIKHTALDILPDAAPMLGISTPLLTQAAAEQVEKAHPHGLDLLLNNAGNQESVCRAVET